MMRLKIGKRSINVYLLKNENFQHLQQTAVLHSTYFLVTPLYNRLQTLEFETSFICLAF